MSADLHEYFRKQQTLVNDRLAVVLRDLAADCPHALTEALRYSLLAPGKRPRPALVFMAAQAAGGTDAQALPAASAVENASFCPSGEITDVVIRSAIFLLSMSATS